MFECLNLIFGFSPDNKGTLVGEVMIPPKVRFQDKFHSFHQNGDAKLIVSGVLDVANALATFLPPPASAVTGALSGILGIFGVGGGPSTEDVIREEFQKMKDFTSRQFEKQTKVIAGEFADQKKFIKQEFEVQNDFIDQRIADVESEIMVLAEQIADATEQIANATDFIQDELTSQKNLTLELFLIGHSD